MFNQPTRRSLLKAAAVLPLAAGAAARPADAMRPADSRLYGSAVRADRLGEDRALQAAVIQDCGWITPEIDFKWNALEYRRDGWWFERADALVGFARANGKLLRGHTLLWDQSTPDWAKADMAERRDWALVERWFAQALGRYGRDACEWDVVNEPIDTEGGDADMRRTCFQRAFGSEYVERALRLASTLAPGLRLIVNEYGLDYTNHVERDRRRAFIALVERLLARGVPLHGVGVQAHLDLAKGPLDAAAITEMLRTFDSMGLTVTITELDVREADRALPIGARDAAVADEVRRYLDIVLAEPVVRGVVTWGVSDRDSWLQEDIGASSPTALNRGLPRDAAFQPKPVYWALRESLEAGGRIA
jgi:endo-1,4-beta-xylanase